MAEERCEVWFYHLERTGVEQALPELLEKALGRGWRAVVRACDRGRLAELDGHLWSWRDDSFLPHGLDDEPAADRQPVLLTTGFGNPNGSQALVLLDGAEAGDLAGYARCLVLLDGADEAQLSAARGQWSRLKADGFAVSYWREKDRGWEKQA